MVLPYLRAILEFLRVLMRFLWGREKHFQVEMPPKCSSSVNIVLNATYYNFSVKVYSLTQTFNLIRILQHISYQFIIANFWFVKDELEARKSSEASPTTQRSKEQSKESVNAAPDSPSKQLPDQISFFSGNPSVEIVHGIMHLYKTK